MNAQLQGVAFQDSNLQTAKTPTPASKPTPPTKPAPPAKPAKPVLKLSLNKTAVPTPQTTELAPQNTGRSYAMVAATAAADATPGFTVVTSNTKQRQKGPQTIRPIYDPNDQKVIVQIHLDTPPRTEAQQHWQYLQLANKWSGST